MYVRGSGSNFHLVCPFTLCLRVSGFAPPHLSRSTASRQRFALPSQISAIMRDFKPSWFVAGGWAIDLFLEKETRIHQDIEVAIFRKDQTALHDYFNGWLLQKIVNGEPLVWQRDEWLTLPTHEIHCFNEPAQPPQIEILLNESNETEWLYRRNQKIRRSLFKIHSAFALNGEQPKRNRKTLSCNNDICIFI